MTITPTDQRDLVLPLFAGILERPVWQNFLRRLLARTGAARAGLVVRAPGGARLDCWAEADPPLREIAAAQLALRQRRLSGALRPMRVYSLGEALDALPLTAQTEAQALLAVARIAHLRIMRVPAAQGLEAWAMLEHGSRDFTAADTALLSALGPNIAVAVNLLRETEEWRRRAELAEDALSASGASQALLDREGRVIAVDGARLGSFDMAPGQQLALGSDQAAELADALAGIAAGQTHQAVLTGAGRPGRQLLLRPPPPGGGAMPAAETAVALAALPRRRSPGAAPRAAQVLARLYGLSPREADLAAALSEGAELVPAGVRLGLTPETTRNYSKRIYAKTGTRGQADLVRLVLSGLARFAGSEPAPAG